MENKPLIARRIIQNNQEFLLSIMDVVELRRYTKYTERIITEFDEDNFPVYNPEIQRHSDPGKVRLIADYLINDPQAMFPTNIVLAIPSFVIDDFTEDKMTNMVQINLNPKVQDELSKENGDVYISVIDGQHRLRGLELAMGLLTTEIEALTLDLNNSSKLKRAQNTLENLKKFQVAVTFFIDPVLEFQASIFSTINRTQTKVSESLVYSLFGLTDKESPQRTSLEITLSLNSVRSSPFYNRIKLVGWKYKRGESPPLTQAAMVKSLIKCISANVKESEKDRFRKREELSKGITPDLCFRRYYANKQDTNISKILFSYFDAVKQSFLDQNSVPYWDLDARANILHTTVGYETLLNLLKLVLQKIDADIKVKKNVEEDKYKIDTYKKYLLKAKDIKFEDFEHYPRTSITKTTLLEDLRNSIF